MSFKNDPQGPFKNYVTVRRGAGGLANRLYLYITTADVRSKSRDVVTSYLITFLNLLLSIHCYPPLPTLVGVHIRRTDKLIAEASFYPFEEYMKFVLDYFEHHPHLDKQVYVASDDPGSTFAKRL